MMKRKGCRFRLFGNYHVLAKFCVVLIVIYFLIVAYSFYEMNKDEEMANRRSIKQVSDFERVRPGSAVVDPSIKMPKLPVIEPFSAKQARQGHVDQSVLVLNQKLNSSGKLEDSVQNAHIATEPVVKNDSVLTIRPNLVLSTLGFVPDCDITDSQALSALQRAKTMECKRNIVNISCVIEKQLLYPRSLPRYCPAKGVEAGKYLGCYGDDASNRYLGGISSSMKKELTPAVCINLCLQAGFPYAGVEYSWDCYCGTNYGTHPSLNEADCSLPCTGNDEEMCGGTDAIAIYQTGFRVVKNEKALKKVTAAVDDKQESVRIVFILTVNGRALRQIRRLFKALYHVRHYYFIHVDARQDYLYRELLPLEASFANVKLSHRRLSTIWGGASLLTMLLQCMEDVLQLNWKWDYFVNLSESDFPIKTNEELTAYLTANKGLNFLKSHGKDTPKFLKKQGLHRTFLECELRMWRIGSRALPEGIRIDGGSDWVGLHRDFCKYLVSTNDTLVSGLKQIYSFTLLPAESFFHTVLHNSEFCETFVDNNLHVTNWRRKQGCKCQYKHIVDWCGCSPNDFKPTDLMRLQATENRPVYFARKFEAIVNQHIIDDVETWLHGAKLEHILGATSYWQNEYHHLDISPKPSSTYLTYYHSYTRLASRQEQSCHLKPKKLLEVHVYKERESLKGLLVKFEAVSDKDVLQLETLIQPIKMYRVLSHGGAAGRLKSLQVGSDFDQKEQIFRNYGTLLGVYSEPAVIHEWGNGPEVTPTLVFIDPLSVIAAVHTVEVKAGPHIGYYKPGLQQPLRPGVWSVMVLTNGTIMAELTFVISPAAFINGEPITSSQAAVANRGPPDGKYADKDLNVSTLNLNQTKDHIRIREANNKAWLSSNLLHDWIDEILSTHWRIHVTCRINKSESCVELDLCGATTWSSMSPDPKSEITRVDSSAGTLVR